MDRKAVTQRFWKKLLVAPSVVWPMVLGLGCLAVRAITDISAGGTLAVVGAVGVGLGLAMIPIRWVFGSKRIAEQVEDEIQREENRTHERYVRVLYRRLRHDNDPRTGQALRRLEKIRDRLEGAGAFSTRQQRWLPEIRGQVEDLYRHCLDSLERTFDLWQSSKEMVSEEARQVLLSEREELVEEIGSGIEHLSATIDHFQSSRLKRQSDDDDARLEQMREELAAGLEVARRVEQRVEELDSDLKRQREK